MPPIDLDDTHGSTAEDVDAAIEDALEYLTQTPEDVRNVL